MTLSTRARNTLRHALNLEDSVPIPSSKTEIVSRLRAIARERFQHRLAADRIRFHLLCTPHGGALTAREILAWLGLPDSTPEHVCVCRHCGKKFK